LMPKENDLEGDQDQGGKHGGQAGMPSPEPAPNKKLRKAQEDRNGPESETLSLKSRGIAKSRGLDD
jgi:hypothetical protein